MKQKLVMILLAAFSLLAVTQVEANDSVTRTANTWLLTPASWHPGTPNKYSENYPFDLKAPVRSCRECHKRASQGGVVMTDDFVS